LIDLRSESEAGKTGYDAMWGELRPMDLLHSSNVTVPISM